MCNLDVRDENESASQPALEETLAPELIQQMQDIERQWQYLYSIGVELNS